VDGCAGVTVLVLYQHPTRTGKRRIKQVNISRGLMSIYVSKSESPTIRTQEIRNVSIVFEELELHLLLSPIRFPGNRNSSHRA
jgi:sulfur transfer protein SufE